MTSAAFALAGLGCAAIFSVRIGGGAEQRWSWDRLTSDWLAAVAVCGGGLALATMHGVQSALVWSDWHSTHGLLIESARALALAASEGADAVFLGKEVGGGSAERLRLQLALGHVDPRLVGIEAGPGLVVGLFLAALSLAMLVAVLVSI